MHKPQVLSAFLSTFWTNAFIAVLGLVTGVLLARSLGPVGRGEFLAIQLIPTLLTPFAMVGQGEAVTYFSAREPWKSRTYLANGICISGIGAIAFGCFGLWLVPKFLANYPREIVFIGIIYLTILPVQALVGLAYQPFRSIGDFTTWNLLRIMPVVCWFIFVNTYGLLATAPVPEDLAIGHLGIIFLMALPFLFFVSRRLNGAVMLSTHVAGPISRYGLVVLGASIPGYIVSKLDQFVAVGSFSPSEAGVYAVALSWSTICGVAVQALVSVVLPRIAGEISDQKRRANALTCIRVGFFCCILWASIVAVSAPVLVPLLYGDAFADAVNLSAILCIAACAIGFNSLLLEVVRGLGTPGRLFFGDMASLLTVGLAYIALSDHLSPIIIASISVMGGAVGLIVTLIVLRRKLATSTVSLLIFSVNDLYILRELIVKTAFNAFRR